MTELDQDWTIPRLLAWAAGRFGEAQAIVDGSTVLTYDELAMRAQRMTRALMALGVAHGDRVAIWAPNSWEWVVAALGAQSAGAVLVPLNTRFKGREAAFILRRSGARVLFTFNGFLDVDYVAQLREAAGGEGPDQRPVAELPALEAIVVGRGRAPRGTLSWDALLGRTDEIPAAAAEVRARAVEPWDLSDLLFTSGTTGLPKGVMATHGQSIRVFRTWAANVGLRAGDRYLIVNPYFHCFGYKAGWLSCLLSGAVNLPEPVFDVAAVLARIARERVTVLPGPPTLYHAILNHPGRAQHDLSSLRLAVTGAAAIPVELILRMRSELTFEDIFTAYGLTETNGVVTLCGRGDDPETIAKTSGRALPGTEVKVVDRDGVEVPRGQPGEVWVRGYNVMKGYYDEPVETGVALDRDGWLRTGDVGVMNERGYLRITDRTKDMFIVGGFNAYPAEIENLLLGNTKIAQAAVVGVPDERLGEVGMAFVVLRPGAEATADELIAWARREMANYKAPRYVELVGELPLNATGKVLKYQLRERAAAQLQSRR
jgi:acyl-CoA synthetase (AMP-forming)/AMP-acid ligase II